MFVEIWTYDCYQQKIIRHLMIRNILAIEKHNGYNTCVVNMLGEYKYAHHESAEVLIERIKGIQNGN
jgi:hypothetical protein